MISKTLKSLIPAFSSKVPVSNRSLSKDEISLVYISILGTEKQLQQFAKSQEHYEPTPDFLQISTLTDTVSSMHVNFPWTTRVEQLSAFTTAAFDERLIFEVTHPDLKDVDDEDWDDCD